MNSMDRTKIDELTVEQLDVISGGNFLLGYAGGKILDALFTQAMNTHDLFQNSDLRLPYNRL